MRASQASFYLKPARFQTLVPVCRRSAAAGAADHSSHHRPAGEHREGSVRGGVEGEVARRGRGGEDLLLQGREVVVPRSRNLPDHHAQTREHPGLYCC